MSVTITIQFKGPISNNTRFSGVTSEGVQFKGVINVPIQLDFEKEAAIVATGGTTNQSGGLLTMDYTTLGTENNRPPWVLDVSIAGTQEEGNTLTITCLWDAQSSGTIPTQTLDVYYQDVQSTFDGALNKTFVETINQDSNTSNGTYQTTVFTYALDSGDTGKYIIFEFDAVVSGVTNTTSSVLSNMTTSIGASLPAVYSDAINVARNGDYSSGWADVGSEGGTWDQNGSAPTVEADGAVDFGAATYLSKAVGASSGGNYTLAVKFRQDSNASVMSLMEFSNNRDLEILTDGRIRFSSTSNVTTTGTISTGIEYNMTVIHQASGDALIRIEENGGTLVLNETLTGSGTNGIAANTAYIAEKDGATLAFDGAIWEFARWDSDKSASITDIMTRLKSL